MKKKQNAKILIGAIVIIAVVAVAAVAYWFVKPKTQEGTKQVSITVVNKAGEKTTYNLKTDAEYLIEAMEEAKEKGLTYEGEEGDYGIMLQTVNGEQAVYEEDGAYWGFFVNGEYCNYGASEQPVVDGDEFEIRYTISE